MDQTAGCGCITFWMEGPWFMTGFGPNWPAKMCASKIPLK